MTNLIYEKMAKILSKVDCIEKGRTNQHQGFKFRGIDDALNALHSVFAEEKVFLLHDVLDHSVSEKPTKQGGISFHHLVKVRFHFIADDGSEVCAIGIGEAADTGDKGAGKAMSYALKVCLLQTFLIPTEEDKDPDASTTTWAPKQSVKDINSEMVRRGATEVPDSKKQENINERSARQFKEAIAFESKAPSQSRDHINACMEDKKQAQEDPNESYAYPKHRDLVVAAAKELGISAPRITANRDKLNEFLYTNAYGTLSSVKQAMDTFFKKETP